jgi:lipopolysaccharide exporter
MSIARQTVRGALWTISTGFGSRLFGLAATLIVTRFVAPADYGEVMIAVVLVSTANQVSTLGLGQYVIAHPRVDRASVFHASVYFALAGAIALGLVAWFAGGLGLIFGARDVTRYVPGLVASAALDRFGFMPERLLVRDMRFGVASGGRALGEFSYSAGTIVLAAMSCGAMAIVGGNLLRSFSRSAVFVGAVKVRDWLSPSRLEARRSRELFAFGAPLSLAGLASFASRRWDNLLVAHYFGAGTTGMYNLAYNLADVPAIQIGEQVGDVLLPSFARLAPERRALALARSILLLCLVVSPMAVGLGAVAPTLVRLVFDARWQPVQSMLVILSALSVTRPVGGTIEAYLQAQHRPRTVMALELFKLGALLLAIVSFGRYGPLWTCSAVGVAFAAHMLMAIAAVQRVDRVPLRRMLTTVGGPILACVPLIIAVLAARRLWSSLAPDNLLVGMLVEVSAGALAYVLTVWWFAPEATLELVSRVKDALPGRATRKADGVQGSPRRSP